MNKTKIAVFVSGGGTNLQAIIDAQKNETIKSGEVVAVISDSANAYALERAKQNNIAAFIIEEKNILDFESNIHEILIQNNIEMIVLAGFMRILSADFISKWSNLIINIHPSLIPSFCGKGCYGIHVHEKALEYGVKVTGATVHYVNEIPDGGKIISQKAVEILPSDTPETLQKRVMEEVEWVVFPKAVEKVALEIAKKRR